jgi:solute carrier family 25 (mitochondrial folate transporter), member 32
MLLPLTLSTNFFFSAPPPLHSSAATTITYPLQLMKTRMQQRMYTMDLYDDSSIRMVQRSDAYRSMTSTIQKIYQQEGIAGFFKGCATNAVRVAPGAAITFVVYEEVSDWLK